MAKRVESRNGSSLEALLANFTRLGRDGLTTLLVPWLVIACADLVFVGVSMLMVVMTGGAEAERGALVIVQVITFVQALIIMTLRVALLKPLRDVAFRGPAGVRDFRVLAVDVVRHLIPAFLITVVVAGLVSVGLMLCIVPGVIALFVLAFAPYLVVARNQGIAEGVGESIRWARRQWPLLLTALIVALVATGTMACAVGAVSGLGTNGALSLPAAMLTGWAVNTVLGYIAFLWWGAVYVTADSEEQLLSIRETASRPAPPAVMPSIYKYRGSD